MRRRALVLGGSLIAVLALATVGGAQLRPIVPGPRLPVIAGGGRPGACAWPFIVDVDNSNVAYPDPNATYWAMPFALSPDEAVVLHGTYPSARFMAVTLYTPAGDTIAQLSDLDITPDPGSANPYAVAALPPGSGRGWQLTVAPSGAAPDAANVLELEPGQRTGWILYRVYLGNPPGDLQGSAPLPTLEYRRGGRLTRTLAPCATFLPGTAIEKLLEKVLPPPLLITAAPQFVRLANDSGLFANEANAYLSAFSDAEPGEILVVRGKLPTTPDTEAGQSVVGDFALRYFSITSNLDEKPYPTVDGLYDHELPLDDAGFYTVVVARDGDVPANATAASGIAVLRWGAGGAQAVIVRNMLPAAGFPMAVQDVTPSTYGAPSDAAATMGEFYPRIAACTKETFAALGPDGCLAGAG